MHALIDGSKRHTSRRGFRLGTGVLALLLVGIAGSLMPGARVSASTPTWAAVPPAATPAALPTPIDLDGTYKATNTHCWWTSLAITGWIGWTPLDYDGAFNSSQGPGWETNNTGPTKIRVGTIGAYYFVVSSSASRVTLTTENGNGCTMVNSHPESLASLPTISGTQTDTSGTPYGPGVLISGNALPGTTDSWAGPYDGRYEFWVQPANTYTVIPQVLPPGQPHGVLSQCTGHKIPRPNGCTFVVYPSKTPDHGTASWVYPIGIGGTVTDADGSPIAGIEVTLAGTDSRTGKPVNMQAVTATDGGYTFQLDPGQYSVTAGPDPAGGRFLVTYCSGTSAEAACKISLKSGQFDTADFRRAALVVNSTRLGTDEAEVDKGICDITPAARTQTCTLPQAILVATHLGGQPIAFNIPTGSGNTFDRGVPQIKVTTGTTIAVGGNTIIDATSQPGVARVELSGKSADNSITGGPYTVGLNFQDSGSTVKGMVINGYSDGIEVTHAGNTIQGDWFGTNAAGSAPAPDPLGTNTSSLQLTGQIGVNLGTAGNQIGGPDPGQGNVFVTHWAPSDGRPAAALYDQSGGNTLQGNAIGVVPGTRTALIDPRPGPKNQPEGALSVKGSDTIGGAIAGDGNVIAPFAEVGSSVVQGNTFLGDLGVDGKAQVGGSTTMPGKGLGNTFNPTISPASGFLTDRELEIGGNGAVAQGNRFNPTGDPAVVIIGDHVTIGGDKTGLGNAIDGAASDPRGSENNYPEVDGAITILGDHNTVENNVVSNSGGRGAVQIQSGAGNTITRNSMTGNSEGIVFGTLPWVYDSDVTKNPSGPNDLEYYPVLFSTSSSSSGTAVQGRIEQPGTVTVDIYSQKSCSLQAVAPGQGEQFLGSTTLSSTLGGEDFSLTGLRIHSGQNAITATATASDGSTSEFSSCLLTDSHAPQLLGYGVRPSSTTVAITVTTAATAGAMSSIAGHGTLSLLCPARTPGTCRGTVVIETSGNNPATITKQTFTMVAGSAAEVTIKLSGALLALLEKAHTMKVRLTTFAKDSAKPPNSQIYKGQLLLTYR